MADKLFVYGTLKPGESMNHLVSSIDGTWQKATVRGKLIEPGSTPDVHYPGVILNDNGDNVDGYLFTSENLSHHWHTIDRYEGRDYERVITEVTTEDGETVDAYIYELKKSK